MLNVNRLHLPKFSLSISPPLVTRVASEIAVLVGFSVLVGWYFDIEILKRGFIGSMATMKANTALCFVLCGVSLWLLQLRGGVEAQGKQGKQGSQGEKLLIPHFPLFHSPSLSLPHSPHVIARVCAVAVIVISGLTLSEYLLHWNLGIDELLFRDSLPSLTTVYPGRMGVNTAVTFMLVGKALELLSSQKTRRSFWYVQIITLIAMLIVLQSIIGYAYKVQILYGVAPYTRSMALHTALTLMTLCIGIICTRLDQGFMRVVVSNTYGGLLARRLLIAAIAIPLVLGWLIVKGQQAAYYDPAFAVSLLVTMLIISFTILIWQTATVIEQLSKERDRVLQALKQNEQKLNCFVDANVIGIMFADVDGNIQQANDEFLRMIGYTRGDLQANKISWIDITPPEYLHLDEQGIAEAKGTGACAPYEKEFIHKDGSRFPVLVGYVLLGKNRSESVAFILDLSDRKQTEKALSLGYKRLNLLFDTASDLLSSQQPVALIESLFIKLSEQIGLDTYFNYLVEENKPAMRLASYSGISEELAKEIEWLEYGQAVCGTVAVEQRPITVANVQQSTDPKTEIIRSFGIQAYYEHPLIAQGKLLGTLSFASRNRLKFTQNEMGMMQAVCDQIAIAIERANLIASLQQQTQQLTEANRMKDEFLAILSHELRSPLNAILGWAQLLRSGKQLKETQIAKALETIERNAKMQTQLIEDLLDISRMIRGKLRLNVYTYELLPIIERAIDNVRLAADAKEIQIQSILDRHTGVVLGDAERLQQVVWNLLSNAIKFTPKEGRVTVRLFVESSNHKNHHSPSYATIQISDTGVGIKPEFLPYVFDRFRQADSSSTRSHGGLGLGLAIVRHLVELHGGTVHVESQGENQGATFTVKLPLPQASKELEKLQNTKDKEDSTKSLKSSTSLPKLDGVRVLVVDDEADIRDFVRTVLEQCEAEVKTAASAADALEILQEWHTDVLVSDIGMPEEDGYSLIRKVRSQSRNIPAAALTAYARAEDRTRALQEGFQIHLPKPVEPAELATVVASLVRRK